MNVRLTIVMLLPCVSKASEKSPTERFAQGLQLLIKVWVAAFAPGGSVNTTPL